MADLLIRGPEGYDAGYTAITSVGETHEDTGIGFGIVRLGGGAVHEPPREREGAALLLSGEVALHWEGERRVASRRSLFDEGPVALHFPAGAEVRLEASGSAELALFEVDNDAEFPVAFFDGESLLETDHRGRGLLDDTAYRLVRTIFDGRNRPEARLVLGEVVALPGRWSSYPPHHHEQPELYHYRFTDPRAGYGHGELGDDVFKVRHHDTLKILGGRDHAQVAAPGYGMYYIWAIRHLPGAPYTTPEFAEEHRWLLEPGDRGRWSPAVGGGDDR